MGEWDDLEKALNDFVEWADDFFELERQEVEEELEYPEGTRLKKDGTPDMRFKENRELYGEEEYVPSPEVLAGYESPYADEVEEEEEEEEEEVWYSYFTTLEGGYWGTEWFDDVEEVYFSNESGMESEAEDRIVEDYGERYYGKDNEILGNANSPDKITVEEVDFDREL
jgi:hypothetical protein